jgi:dihydrofolate reductase
VRRVIVQEFVTLDGFAAGPNGELDFIAESTDVDSVDSDAARDQLSFTAGIDTILLGSVTYGMFSQYWPEQTTDTELIAEALNTIPKVVFSRTLTSAPWGTWPEARVVSGSAAEEVRRLKAGDGKDLVVWGSLSIARALMRDGLVDEFHLWFCPIVLGSGKRLFAEGIEVERMRWLDTKSYDGGVVSIRAEPVRD